MEIEQENKKNIFLTYGAAAIAILFLIFLFGLGVLLSPSIGTERYIEIPKGANAQNIADDLYQQGIIRSPLLFVWYARLIGADTQIKQGAYAMSGRHSIPNILHLITSRGSERSIRIMEGWTNYEIASYLEDAGLVSKKDFLNRATNTEGYLFPDTYRVFANTSPTELLAMMRETFNQKINPFRGDMEKKNLALRDVVIMASLVEKESSGTDDDRAIIAGILWKRLRDHRPLQIDATLTYLTGKPSKDLTIDDLKIDSPYNTYRYLGLPAGPIGNPGVDAIRATVYSQETSYWFYLHDNDGKPHYAKTFEEHIVNKNQYLR